MYAVFDANNFFVSCERVVQPKLQKVPLVVANPGGIILARSEEAKAYGIKMAEPLFKAAEKLRQFNIRVADTNFALYSDLSKRIAIILHDFFPFVEEYSIDESFVFFPPSSKDADIRKTCEEVRMHILRWIGIPVSVGIAPTKTLAKVAVKLAKKQGETVIFTDSSEYKHILEKLPVQEVWGVGYALGKKLPTYGISTAAQLAAQDPLAFRKKFSVTLAYTVNELNSVSCFTADKSPQPPKSLMCTESYRTAIEDISQLEVRLRILTMRAARQLRKQKEVSGAIGVFVRGDRFHKEKGYLALQEFTTITPATANTTHFLRFIERVLPKLFPYGAKIKRAGVYLVDLIPESDRQYGLFEGNIQEKAAKEELAMKTIDSIEKKWGTKPNTFLSITI